MIAQASRPIARSVAATARLVARRGYAEEAGSSSKLRLSLVLPHSTIYSSSEVLQVNIEAASGAMGILSNHVPTLEPLKPGVLEVIESGSSESKKWFVSGGFASVHPSNLLTVNAVEAYPLDAFSAEAIKSGFAEAQKVASGNGSEEEKAEAKAELEVFEALSQAVRAA